MHVHPGVEEDQVCTMSTTQAHILRTEFLQNQGFLEKITKIRGVYLIIMMITIAMQGRTWILLPDDARQMMLQRRHELLIARAFAKRHI